MGRVIEVSLLPFPLLESPIYTLIAMIDSPSVPLQKHAVPPPPYSPTLRVINEWPRLKVALCVS